MKSLLMVIIGIFLLNAIVVVNESITALHGQDTISYWLYIQEEILYFLFGILIQWKRIRDIRIKKSFKPNYLLFPSMILVIIGIIPEPVLVTWVNHLPPLICFILNPLNHSETNAVIGVLSGFLLIQSLEAY